MDLVGLRELRVARTRDDLVFGPGERPLGGGTWLFSEPQPGLTGLVDLMGMGWEPITVSGGLVTIAATCTIAEVSRFDHELFAKCADSLLASWKIWNAATVGGNLCLSLPAGPMTSLAVSLDGVAVLWTADGGERRVPVADFVTGVGTNVLERGEVLRAIELPSAALDERSDFRRISLQPLGRTGTLVIRRGDVITVSGGTRRPHVLRDASELDAALWLDSIADWYEDAHGSPDWREAMTRRFVAELT